MAVEARKQKTIDEAIIESSARNKCSAWYFLMKNVAPDRSCYEKLLLIHLLLHTGIDKSEWNFSDEEMICRLGCSRAMLYALVKSCESDYLFRREGSPDRRKYILSIENLVETLTPDHQADFYSRLGWTRREIELRVPPSHTSGRLPRGQDVHQIDDSSTTWNSCPGGGREFQEVDAPNKEEEQLEEQEQEHLKPQLQTARGCGWQEVEERIVRHLREWKRPLAELQLRVSPDYATEVLDVYERSAGIYGDNGPGILHQRLMNCHPAACPSDGWPEQQLSPRLQSCVQLLLEAYAHALKQSNSETLPNRSDVEEFCVRQALKRDYSEREARQAIFAARMKIDGVIVRYLANRVNSPRQEHPSNPPQPHAAAASTARAEDIPLPDCLDCEPFLSAWAEWLAYRRERRLSVRERTMTSQLAALTAIGAAQAADCVRLSIRNGWQGIFPEKFSKIKSGAGVVYDPHAVTDI